MSETTEQMIIRAASLALDTAEQMNGIVKDSKDDDIRIRAAEQIDNLVDSSVGAIKHNDHAGDVDRVMDLLKDTKRKPWEDE